MGFYPAGGTIEFHPCTETYMFNVSHLVKTLSVVHGHHGPDHLRNYNHVPQVGANGIWLFTWCGFHLGLSELLHERKRLSLQPSGKSESRENAVEALLVRSPHNSLKARPRKLILKKKKKSFTFCGRAHGRAGQAHSLPCQEEHRDLLLCRKTF